MRLYFQVNLVGTLRLCFFSSMQLCFQLHSTLFSALCNFVFSSIQLYFQLHATLFSAPCDFVFSSMQLFFSSMQLFLQFHATLFSAPCDFVFSAPCDFVFSSMQLCFQLHATLLSGEPGWDAACDKSVLAAAEELRRARAHGVQRGGCARLSGPLCLLCH